MPALSCGAALLAGAAKAAGGLPGEDESRRLWAHGEHAAEAQCEGDRKRQVSEGNCGFMAPFDVIT